MMKSICLLLLLTVAIVLCCSTTNATLKATIYPYPTYIDIEENVHFFQDDCLDLTLQTQLLSQSKMDENQFDYYLNTIQLRQNKLSKCNAQTSQSSSKWQIIVKQDPTVVNHLQGYKVISSTQNCVIYIKSYAGYVYAMETISQLIHQNTIMIGVIQDQPSVQYRGIMIDSIRHFIGYSYVERLIKSMPVVKLNMLHWHLSDDQAFVLQLITHPQLAASGSYDKSSFYTQQQMKDLIALAEKNAVNIIPQFDTPAHIRSWGLSQKWKSQNITILCPGGQHYNHQFDLSKQAVYKLSQQVLQQIDNLFIKSPYLHLGGDQTSSACWDLRPSIKTFMKLKNIKDYQQLQTFWRYQLKQAIPSSRKVIFWETKSQNIKTGPEDVVQYWGKQSQIAATVGKSQSKIILSPSDIIYLNQGQSFIWENQTFGQYFTWKKIYQNFTVFPEGINKQQILGAEACLWGEVSNQDTLQNNLWPRLAAFGLKVWSSTVLTTSQLVGALVNIQIILLSQGVQVSPIVSKFCEKDPITCYKNNNEAQIQ